LIIMPTHGYGPFRRFLLGSVTAKVLHDAECPVWTGAHLQESADQHWGAMNHVVCAIDGGPESERVLTWASNFAAEFKANTTIVLAIPQLDPSDDLFDSEGFVRRVGVAEARIRCLLAKSGARGDVMVEEGEPAKVVSEAVRRVGADLAVIGRSAAGGSGRLRTNAYSIIRESPCPVVSV
jgi:nucleotide-binding universal stress UspA family protein